MNEKELQALLDRCEAGTASCADLSLLGILLQAQNEEWTTLRAALASGLQAEVEEVSFRSVDLVATEKEVRVLDEAVAAMREGLLHEASDFDMAEEMEAMIQADIMPALDVEALEVPPRLGFLLVPPEMNEPLAPAFDLLTEGLDQEAADFDICSAVMDAIMAPEPSPDESLERALAPAFLALNEGLVAEAVSCDVSEIVLRSILSEEGPGLSEEFALAPVMEALGAGLAAEAVGFDIADGVMMQVETEPVLEAAFEALRAGLEAEALGFDAADPIMARVLSSDEASVILSALADGELSPAMRQVVGRRLAVEERSRSLVTGFATLGQELRQAHRSETCADQVPSIWPDVARSLGLEGTMDHLARELQEGLAFEARDCDVADAVMARLASPRAEPVHTRIQDPTEQAETKTAGSRWIQRVPIFTFLAGMAAVLLVVNSIRTTPEVPEAPEKAVAAIQLADRNETRIEELTVGENTMVQVFQLEDGAPVVIFVEEGVPDSDGVTL